jgi:type II secretory pathway component PulM
MNFSTLLSNRVVQLLLERYQDLQAREQLSVKVLSFFMSIILLIYLILIPLQNFSENAKHHYQSNADVYNWMKKNAPLVSPGFSGRNNNESLLGVASASAKKYYISFNRYESLDEGALRVNLEGVSFKNVILWLEFLQKNHSINVSKISIDQQGTPAYVNVRVVLQG